GLRASFNQNLDFVECVECQLRRSRREAVRVEYVSNDVHVDIVGQRFRIRSTEAKRRHLGSDQLKQRLRAVIVPAFHEAVALQCRYLALAPEVGLMASGAIRGISLLAALGLGGRVRAVPNSLPWSLREEVQQKDGLQHGIEDIKKSDL